MTARQTALVALLVLGAALVVAVVVLIPWDTLGGRADPTRDFTAAQIARENAFHADLRPWSYGRLGLALVVAGVLGLTPLGARLIGAMPGPWWVQTVLGTAAVLVVGRLVTLPLSAKGYTVLRNYGLSTQTWGGWAGDVLRSLVVAVVVTAIAMLVLVALARAFPRGWWAPMAVAGAALVVIGSFVYPLLIEPVFNKFTPMEDGRLRSDLIAMAERDGVPVEDVLVADASRRTSTLNAYVSGFGATRRIVVYDNLLREAPDREVELVVAHELGHAADNDVLVGTLIGALAVGVAATAGYLVFSWMPLLRRADVSSLGDPRSVALVLFVIAAVTLLTSPVQTLLSRRVEARADVHSLDLTGDAATFIEVEKRLATTNLSDLDPHPLVYGMFFTHPTTPERIAMARTWAAREGIAAP